MWWCAIVKEPPWCWKAFHLKSLVVQVSESWGAQVQRDKWGVEDFPFGDALWFESLICVHANFPRLFARVSQGCFCFWGAGKSSLLQVLFRMSPLEAGAVYLDGHDTSQMGLHTLRKSLAIIPQDPVGFTGTVRFNLDPFNQHTDDAIWQELEKVQLKTYFEAQDGQLLFQVAAGGENLSVGQRQLLCCARALIRGTRILVLDEATASVDFTTDGLIQDILQKEVRTKHLTTLTIAHRIQTVLGGDRVLVVADGKAAEFGKTEDLRNNPESMFYTFVQSASASGQLWRVVSHDWNLMFKGWCVRVERDAACTVSTDHLNEKPCTGAPKFDTWCSFSQLDAWQHINTWPCFNTARHKAGCSSKTDAKKIKNVWWPLQIPRRNRGTIILT